MSDLQSLKRENEQLRDRLTVLEESIGLGIQAPRALNLTWMQERIFCCIYRRGFAERETIMAAMYGVESYNKDPAIISVFLCKARRTLSKFSIEINNVYGRGWEMPEQSRHIVRAMLDAERREAA